MKKVLSFGLAAMTLALSGAAFGYGTAESVNEQDYQTRLHRRAGECDAFHQEIPVWSWDRAAHKFVFEGYECRHLPNGGR